MLRELIIIFFRVIYKIKYVVVFENKLKYYLLFTKYIHAGILYGFCNFNFMQNVELTATVGWQQRTGQNKI
jgi:hypothetical protein